MSDRIAIYTVAMGGEYALPLIGARDDASFYCFTDREIEESNGWTVLRRDALLAGDTYRSSRDYKIRPHLHLRDHSRSIYIDTSVQILESPEAIWEQLMPSASTAFGGIFHSYRESVADEFRAVKRSALDYRETLEEQERAYLTYYPSALTERPIWGGFMARRHMVPACQAAMETWFANVLRYSRRDQLSLPLALAQLPDELKNILALDIRSSPIHEWPRHGLPRPAGYKIGKEAGWLERGLRACLRRVASHPRRR